MHGVPIYKVSENIKPALVILEGVVPKILRYREPLALENDTYGVGHNDRRILREVLTYNYLTAKSQFINFTFYKIVVKENKYFIFPS